eukprot:1158533-Pelagomonas_calceolata.AAC.11
MYTLDQGTTPMHQTHVTRWLTMRHLQRQCARVPIQRKVVATHPLTPPRLQHRATVTPFPYFPQLLPHTSTEMCLLAATPPMARSGVSTRVVGSSIHVPPRLLLLLLPAPERLDTGATPEGRGARRVLMYQ